MRGDLSFKKLAERAAGIVHVGPWFVIRRVRRDRVARILRSLQLQRCFIDQLGL